MVSIGTVGCVEAAVASLGVIILGGALASAGSAKDQGRFDRDFDRALAGQEQESRFLKEPVSSPDYHRTVRAVAP